MSSRTHDAQALLLSKFGGIGSVPLGVIGTQSPQAAGNNALRLISTSISDDLSQKDKVEARQFSALMPPTPPKRTKATAHDDSRRRKKFVYTEPIGCKDPTVVPQQNMPSISTYRNFPAPGSTMFPPPGQPILHRPEGWPLQGERPPTPHIYPPPGATRKTYLRGPSP